MIQDEPIQATRGDDETIWLRSFQWCNRGDFIPQIATLEPELVIGLQVHPEFFRRSEVPSQAKRRVGWDTALAVHNLIDTTAWHADRNSELVLCDPETLNKVLHEDLTRMDRLNLDRFQW